MALPGPKTSRRGGNLFETVLSALVIAVAVGFAFFLFVQTGTGHLGSYRLRVSLRDAAELAVGSDVRLGGAKVGSVTALDLDKTSYRALADVSIRDDLFLPADSTATVTSSALGEVYLTLQLGHALSTVPADGTIGLPQQPKRPAPSRAES